MTSRFDTTKQRVTGVKVIREVASEAITGYPKTYSGSISLLSLNTEDYTTQINAFLDEVETQEANLTIDRNNLIKAV